MNKKLILITMTLILNILLINQMKYRNDKLYAVNLKNKIDKNLVSILVSDGSEKYTKYEGSTFPSNTEYTYNSELSKCQDNNGNVIEGILSYDETNGKVNIRTKKTTNCYLYFDKIFGVKIVGNIAQGLIKSGTLWQSGLEGDGYRYIGSGKRTDSTSPNNFICFGTSDLTECKANEEKYMYRIIGVFPDESGEQHLKLIKYKQLSKAYMWHSIETNLSWEESDLYKGLNGISGGSYSKLFIGNTTYDYLQNNVWLNKIVGWNWTVTNTLTNDNSGPDYESITTEQMYLHEMNRSTKTSEIGTWTYPTAKIGLMYASDYQMCLGSSSLIMTSSNNGATLKTGWLDPINNDTTASGFEWFISIRGHGGGIAGRFYFYAWHVDDNGVWNDRVNNANGVSPVFYLDSTVATFDGTGSYSTPYLIG